MSSDSEIIKAINRILVVDDDTYNLLLASKILDKWKVKADYCKNGFEAVQNLTEHIYDFIILDLQMPEANGIFVAQYLQNNQTLNKHTPILLCTNVKIDDDYRDFLKGYAIFYYLFKPFNEEKLLASIKNVFKHK